MITLFGITIIFIREFKCPRHGKYRSVEEHRADCPRCPFGEEGDAVV